MNEYAFPLSMQVILAAVLAATLFLFGYTVGRDSVNVPDGDCGEPAPVHILPPKHILPQRLP